MTGRLVAGTSALLAEELNDIVGVGVGDPGRERLYFICANAIEAMNDNAIVATMIVIRMIIDPD